MKINVAVVNTNGTQTTVKIDNTDLSAYQAEVHGFIEATSGSGWVAYLNEEGKLLGLPHNPAAEAFMRTYGWEGLPGDHIVGPVMFVGPTDEEGDDTSFTMFQEIAEYTTES